MATLRLSWTSTSPSTEFNTYCDRVSQSIAGNYTTLNIYVQAINAGNSSTFLSGAGSQIASIDGEWSGGGQSVGSNFLPSGYANGAQRWFLGPYVVNIPHNSDGTGPTGGVTLRQATVFGSFNNNITVNFNDFPTIPRGPLVKNTDGTWHSTTAYVKNADGTWHVATPLIKNTDGTWHVG